MVVQDAETYERIAQLADYADSILNIRTALAEPGRPFESFAKEFETGHGIRR